MKNNLFEDLTAGLKDAIAYMDGSADLSQYVVRVPEDIDVKAIRTKLRLTQAQFAARFGFTRSQVREWEQGRAQPTHGARAYLKVIQREPEAVARALSAA